MLKRLCRIRKQDLRVQLYKESIMIKYGSVEYFELLDLRDRLKAWKYDKLGLQNLDRLRNEVSIKIEAIHLASKEQKANP
jgi:hypothetical protein